MLVLLQLPVSWSCSVCCVCRGCASVNVDALCMTSMHLRSVELCRRQLKVLLCMDSWTWCDHVPTHACQGHDCVHHMCWTASSHAAGSGH